MAAWQIPELWKGGEAWILGGGPSLTESFNIPNSLVEEVRLKKKTPSAYSPYFAALHKKHVIGVNVAYMIGEWIDICYFGDNNFWVEHQKGLNSWNGIKVTSATRLAKNDLGIKYLPWERGKGEYAMCGISSYPKAVKWNENSGAASISLAAWLGVKRIILVGFDMQLVDNVKHWHNEYSKQLRKTTGKAKKGTPFRRHLLGFPKIQSDAQAMGIEIINASLNSKIECFKKIPVSELL